MSQCEEENQMSALARVSLTERGEVDTTQIYVKEAKLQTKHI